MYGDVTSVDLGERPFTLTVGKAVHTADALIIATGASAKLLGIESEKRLMGYGVSACATCDGFFFKDKDVVVVGGGDTAMEEALFLTKFATQVHRRPPPRQPARLEDHGRARRAQPEDPFVWNAEVDRGARRAAGDGVTGVTLKDTKTGAHSELPAGGVFIAIGHQPNTQLFRGQLEMDENGYIVTNGRTTYTSVDGRVRLRRRAGPRLPPGRHRRRHRLHGGDRRRALAGSAVASSLAPVGARSAPPIPRPPTAAASRRTPHIY